DSTSLGSYNTSCFHLGKNNILYSIVEDSKIPLVERKNVIIYSSNFGETWSQFDIELPYVYQNGLPNNIYFDNNYLYFTIKVVPKDVDKIYRYDINFNRLDSMLIDQSPNYFINNPFFN